MDEQLRIILIIIVSVSIFGLLIFNKWKTTIRNQIIIVTIFGLVYALWIGYTFYQAKQGLPFI